MKSKNTLLLFIILLGFSVFSATGQVTPVGEWLFDNSANLLEANIGQPLVLTGSHTAIAGPTEDDDATRIGKGSYYRCDHGMGASVNTYSILFDFRVGAVGSDYYTFFQTALANNNDGELFIRPNGGIGNSATGYSTTAVVPNTWNRLVVVKNSSNVFSCYLNGERILNTTITGADIARYNLASELLLFADNDGDDNEMDIARVSIYDKSLTEFEVLSLGGILPPPEPVGQWDFDNTLDLTEATIGTDLVLTGGQTTNPSGTGLTGTHIAIPGVSGDDGAVRIGARSHYKATHGIPLTGGYVTTYSLLFDFKVAAHDWICFFQTDPTNTDDGDFFIRGSGGIVGSIGCGSNPGYSTKMVSTGVWNRLVVVVNGNNLYAYLNGESILTGTNASIGTRYRLQSEVVFFGDEDGEDRDIDVSRVAIYDKALSYSEVVALGWDLSKGYPSIPTGFGKETTLQTKSDLAVLSSNELLVTTESNVSLTIFDMQGRAIFQQPDVKNGEIVNIASLKKGAYIAQLKNNDTNYSKVFVK